MLSETVVSTFLVASITGAGLVLAIYALITPISEKIFKERARKLDVLLEEFEKEKTKLTADSSNKHFKNLKNLKDEIEQYKIFPKYLSVGIFVTFLLFMFEASLDSFWLVELINRTVIVGAFFIVAVLVFFFIGIFTISEIASTMVKEFKEINKKQREAKEYTVDDIKVEDIK